MDSEFERQLSRLAEGLDQRRADLLAVLPELRDSDLGRARRGGWTIARVLEHIIGAEWHYAQLVSQLRGLDVVTPESANLAGVADAREALGRSRAALLNAMAGVSQSQFYQLGPVGREEYSVVSVLENVEQHDIEHVGQIKMIQAEGGL